MRRQHALRRPLSPSVCRPLLCSSFLQNSKMETPLEEKKAESPQKNGSSEGSDPGMVDYEEKAAVPESVFQGRITVEAPSDLGKGVYVVKVRCS